MYCGSIAAVSSRFGLTETFDATSGVLEGDALSPHISILLVDYILRQSLVDDDGFALKPANGHGHLAITLTAIAYADDVGITSDSASGANRNLCWPQFYSEAVVLKLNAAKAKILHVGYESNLEPILTLDGTAICDIYNYLSLSRLSSKVVVRQRFTAAWSAIGKLRPIFHSTAPDAFKIELLKSAVKTLATYAPESPLNPTT